MSSDKLYSVQFVCSLSGTSASEPNSKSWIPRPGGGGDTDSIIIWDIQSRPTLALGQKQNMVCQKSAPETNSKAQTRWPTEWVTSCARDTAVSLKTPTMWPTEWVTSCARDRAQSLKGSNDVPTMLQGFGCNMVESPPGGWSPTTGGWNPTTGGWNPTTGERPATPAANEQDGLPWVTPKKNE